MNIRRKKVYTINVCYNLDSKTRKTKQYKIIATNMDDAIDIARTVNKKENRGSNYYIYNGCGVLKSEYCYGLY